MGPLLGNKSDCHVVVAYGFLRYYCLSKWAVLRGSRWCFSLRCDLEGFYNGGREVEWEFELDAFILHDCVRLSACLGHFSILAS